MSRIYYCLSFLLLAACLPAFPQGKVLLAVFAHPDDEAAVAPVLAKYAAEGVNVYLAVVTDGSLGVTPEAKIPAGDTLAAVRATEIKCAAENLGIHPPILLGFPDQLDIQKGFDAETKLLASIRLKLIALFAALKPDVIITWPPGGWTGHPDHRLVGDLVTQVFASTHWDKPVSLYFPGIPSDRKRIDYSPYKLSLVDTAYLTVRIPLSLDDMVRSKAALSCHKSQYDQRDVNHMIWLLWDAGNPVAYFRPFFPRGTNQIKYQLF